MEVEEELTTIAKIPSSTVTAIKPMVVQQVAPRAPSVPWVEKYRPGNIGEVVYQEEVVLTLKKAISTSTLPHLLFYGTPGTGKTSTILAIARQFYRTPKLFKERVLELNASDERGIDVIRHKVKEFGMISTGSGSGGGSDAPPPFKIIILDEADSMTQDAQNALRRTMEVYSSNTRFCLICNFISRIIEPLASRCAKFRFKPIPNNVVVSRLKEISEKENFPIGDDTLESIASASGGDLRKAITNLQSLHATFGNVPEELTPEKVSELSGIVPGSFLDNFVESCESNSMVDLQNTVESITANGFAADRFLSQLYDVVLQHPTWDDIAKGKIIDVIAAADKCLVDGSDEFLQIMYVGSFMMKTLCEK